MFAATYFPSSYFAPRYFAEAGGTATSAEGYYAKHAKMLRKAGTHNLALYTNLDNDTTDEDEDVLQEAMDEADRYVDTRARVKRLTADSGAAPHMIGTDNDYYERISDLASAIAVAEVYRARGFTGDTNNQAEGQMADMDKRAKAELDEIFGAIGAADEEGGNDPGAFAMVPIARLACATDENGGCE